jgi:hypothetical protein
MYEMVPWSAGLDLTDFYSECSRRGLHNNSSESALIGGMRKYSRSQMWILYFNGSAVGSAGAHSLELFGPNAYRICARTCILTDRTDYKQWMRNISTGLRQHQHITAQFFLPTCIEWAGVDSNLFISTHTSPHASHRSVHEMFMPRLAEWGIAEDYGEYEYRGQTQTFWKINVGEFYSQLALYPRWT